jgi:hypothetical protein
MRRILLTTIIAATAAFSTSLAQNPAQRINAPRFWNDKELSDWATPVVGVNVRPGHFSEAEYYAAPEVELVRTYPVYAPGKEPVRYWKMLQKAV